MREIKFRAWDKKTKKMIFTGFHILGEVMAFNLIEQFIFENPCGAKSSLERWNDIVLMEWTGLHDKNGKEIYEGDIVRYEDGDGEIWLNEIVYQEDKGENIFLCGFCGGRHKNISEQIYRENGEAPEGWTGEPEIIGNIYENPKLLKEANSGDV